jgi:predicted lactoylglutathione lyase
VLTAISVDSRLKVNKLVEKAIASGAKEPREAQDYGYMFLRAFEDLDGHTWEIFWMDPKAVKAS